MSDVPGAVARTAQDIAADNISLLTFGAAIDGVRLLNCSVSGAVVTDNTGYTFHSPADVGKIIRVALAAGTKLTSTGTVSIDIYGNVTGSGTSFPAGNSVIRIGSAYYVLVQASGTTGQTYPAPGTAVSGAAYELSSGGRYFYSTIASCSGSTCTMSAAAPLSPQNITVEFGSNDFAAWNPAITWRRFTINEGANSANYVYDGVTYQRFTMKTGTHLIAPGTRIEAQSSKVQVVQCDDLPPFAVDTQALTTSIAGRAGIQLGPFTIYSWAAPVFGTPYLPTAKQGIGICNSATGSPNTFTATTQSTGTLDNTFAGLWVTIIPAGGDGSAAGGAHIAQVVSVSGSVVTVGNMVDGTWANLTGASYEIGTARANFNSNYANSYLFGGEIACSLIGGYCIGADPNYNNPSYATAAIRSRTDLAQFGPGITLCKTFRYRLTMSQITGYAYAICSDGSSSLHLDRVLIFGNGRPLHLIFHADTYLPEGDSFTEDCCKVLDNSESAQIFLQGAFAGFLLTAGNLWEAGPAHCPWLYAPDGVSNVHLRGRTVSCGNAPVVTTGLTVTADVLGNISISGGTFPTAWDQGIFTLPSGEFHFTFTRLTSTTGTIIPPPGAPLTGVAFSFVLPEKEIIQIAPSFGPNSIIGMTLAGGNGKVRCLGTHFNNVFGDDLLLMRDNADGYLGRITCDDPGCITGERKPYLFSPTNPADHQIGLNWNGPTPWIKDGNTFYTIRRDFQQEAAVPIFYIRSPDDMLRSMHLFIAARKTSGPYQQINASSSGSNTITLALAPTVAPVFGDIHRIASTFTGGPFREFGTVASYNSGTHTVTYTHNLIGTSPTGIEMGAQLAIDDIVFVSPDGVSTTLGVPHGAYPAPIPLSGLSDNSTRLETTDPLTFTFPSSLKWEPGCKILIYIQHELAQVNQVRIVPDRILMPGITTTTAKATVSGGLEFRFADGFRVGAISANEVPGDYRLEVAGQAGGAFYNLRGSQLLDANGGVTGDDFPGQGTISIDAAGLITTSVSNGFGAIWNGATIKVPGSSYTGVVIWNNTVIKVITPPGSPIVAATPWTFDLLPIVSTTGSSQADTFIATREINTPKLWVNGAAVGAVTRAQVLSVLASLTSAEVAGLLGTANVVTTGVVDASQIDVSGTPITTGTQFIGPGGVATNGAIITTNNLTVAGQFRPAVNTGSFATAASYTKWVEVHNGSGTLVGIIPIF